MLEGYHQFIKDVTTGKAVVGKLVKQAVERQFNDLKKQRTAEFPYYFDEEEAERWINFIKCLKFTRGKWKGKNFDPQPVQAFKWACIFGWRHMETGFRRYRRVYTEVAKKNGKTEEAAAIAVGLLYIDGENTPQILCAANSRDQAGEVFEAAKSMIKQLCEDSESIREITEVRTHYILNHSNDGYIRKVSTDASNTEGKFASGGVVDEVHLFERSDVIDSIESGSAGRDQPLLYMITTAGFMIGGVCYEIRRNATQVLSGIKTDESLFALISTLDENDDWKDKKNWVKSNPNIGESPKWDFLEQQFNDALNLGGQKEVSFKTKNLNMWVGSSAVWIQDEVWQKCPSKIDIDSLIGRTCFAGIDFASVSDFTALSLLFPPEEENGVYTFLSWFWIPKTVLAIRSRDIPDVLKWSLDAKDFEKYSVEKCVFVTEGNVTDYDYLANEVNRICGMFNVVSIGYDPANAWQTVSKLEVDGLPMSKFSQGIMNMSPPSKEFERLAKKGQINHGGNPVLRWMLSNVVPYYDANENLKIKKEVETRGAKIDGIVACVIALGEYLKTPQENYYSSSDIYLV